MSTAYRDRAGRALSLTPDERRKRAQLAGQASNTVSALVKRIMRQRDQLTADDLAQLATLLPKDVIYLAGMRVGIKLAADKLAEMTVE